jgi:hypothetical protein
MMIYAKVPRSKPKRKPKDVETKPKVVAKTELKRLSNYNLSIPSDRITPDYKSVDTGVTGALTKSGIMRDFHKLSEDDRKIVEKIGNCLAPLHKGNYVYVSEGMNPASLGRKNEVL